MLPYSSPTYKSDGYTCPLCSFYSHQNWFQVYYGEYNHYGNLNLDLELSVCVKCNKHLLWHNGEIVFPVVNGAPPAHPDMPNEIKKIYDEAKSIVSKSSRAS